MGLNISQFSRAITQMSAGEAVRIISSVLLLSVLTRVFSMYEFGIYRFILAIIGYGTIFALPGMVESMAQSVSKGFNSSLYWAAKYRFYGSLIFSVLVFGTIPVLYFLDKNSLIPYFLLMGIFFPFLKSFSDYSYFLQVKSKYRFGSFLISMYHVAISSSVVISAVLSKSLLITLTTYMLFSSLFSYLAFQFVRRRFTDKTEIEDPELYDFGMKLTSLVLSKFYELDMLHCFQKEFSGAPANSFIASGLAIHPATQF